METVRLVSELSFEGVPRIEVRIGIATGLVLVGDPEIGQTGFKSPRPTSGPEQPIAPYFGSASQLSGLPA